MIIISILLAVFALLNLYFSYLLNKISNGWQELYFKNKDLLLQAQQSNSQLLGMLINSGVLSEEEVRDIQIEENKRIKNLN